MLLSSACGKAIDVGDEESTGSESSTGDGESSTGDGESSTGDGDGDGDGQCEAPRCNPLASDCPDGELCLFANTEFLCFVDGSDGAGVAGAPCEMANTCNEGLSCIQGVFFADCAGDACCSPNCDLSEPNTCPNAAAGEVCMQWFMAEETDACYLNVGVCGVAP